MSRLIKWKPWLRVLLCLALALGSSCMAEPDNAAKTKDVNMIFNVSDVEYPLRYANFQRNSRVKPDVNRGWELNWTRAYTEIDSNIVFSPRSLLIAGGFIAVQGASKLLCYSLKGDFLFAEGTATATPAVLGQGAMAFVNPSAQLIYQDYEQKPLGIAERAPRLGQRAYALLLKPSLDKILAVIQFVGMPDKEEERLYVYRFIRESLVFEWKHEFEEVGEHALLNNDGTTLFVISGEMVRSFGAEDGTPGESFRTGLIHPISASINSDDQIVILGQSVSDSKSPIVLCAFSTSGEELWSFPTQNPQRSQPPASGTDGRVYIVDGLRLLCYKDGNLLWSSLLKSDAETSLTITGGDQALVINGQMLLLYDADGNMIYESLITKEGESFETPPVIEAKGRIYVSGNRNLYCFE